MKSQYPFNTKATVVFVIVWNLLIGLDIASILSNQSFFLVPPGTGQKLALLFSLLVSLLVLFFSKVQLQVVKKGVSVTALKKPAVLVLVLSVFLLFSLYYSEVVST